jgi:DHA1 family bicyclomycin/chloramphenicol resistance-like MFS transporter
MAVLISVFIGRFIAETALPLFIGFLVCAALSVVLLIYLKTHKTLVRVNA